MTGRGDYYTLSYFYNWLKNSANSPTPLRLCDIRFYHPYLFSDNLIKCDPVAIGSLFNQLERFVLTIQKIEMPDFKMSNNLEIRTPLGNWNGMDNQTILPDEHNISMQLLESSIPIHETFIWNWYKACYLDAFNTTKVQYSKQNNPQPAYVRTFPYPFPRLNMVIRIFERKLAGIG